MEKTVRIGSLYFVYGCLLTEKQRQMVESYYLDDLSLSEIGENFSITRQAVSEQLNRAVGKLVEYEEALHFLERTEYRTAALNEIAEELRQVNDAVAVKCAARLEALANGAVEPASGGGKEESDVC